MTGSVWVKTWADWLSQLSQLFPARTSSCFFSKRSIGYKTLPPWVFDFHPRDLNPRDLNPRDFNPRDYLDLVNGSYSIRWDWDRIPVNIKRVEL